MKLWFIGILWILAQFVYDLNTSYFGGWLVIICTLCSLITLNRNITLTQKIMYITSWSFIGIFCAEIFWRWY